MTGLETRFARRLRRPWTAPGGVKTYSMAFVPSICAKAAFPN